MKVDFVRSSILDLKDQRCFGKDTGLDITSATGTTSMAAVNNLTNPATSSTAHAQILSKKQSISSQATNDLQSSTESQGGASNNTAMNSKQNEIGSSSKLETGNKKTQQNRNKAKQPRQETNDQEPVINNLANISSASASCKSSPEFLNIPAEEEENCSDSSSEENKTATSGLQTTKLIEKENKQAQHDDESQLKKRLTTQSSSSSSSAAKSSDKEPKNNSLYSKTKSEPQQNEDLDDSSKSRNVNRAAAKDPSSNRRSGNDKKTLASAVPSDLPKDEASNDFVKKWVMGGDDKQSDIKEPDTLTSSTKDAVKVERQRKLSVSSTCSSVPDPQKCTPSKKAVFDYILKEYDGTVSFAEISSRQDLFPNGCGDVVAWFKARKGSFLLNEGKYGTILEVSAFCRRAQLCFSQACTRPNCQYLHVCRDFIAGCCRFGDRCQRNHRFQYDKDGKVLSKLKLNGLAEENLRKVIQLSIPQVCLDYNEGGCARGQSCNKIHICKEEIRKKCKGEEDCGLQHQDALLTAHSTAILQKYGLTVRDGNVGPVLRALLVCDEKPAALKGDGRRTFSTAYAEATSIKVYKKSVSIPPEDAAVGGYEPSERKVFECLCKEYSCSASFSEIAKRTDLFPSEFKDIETWFRKKKGSFRLTENDDSEGSILQVNAFSTKARLCFSYNSAHNGTCTKEACSYLHVCRDYVTDSCSDGATCPKNHHFHNAQDTALLTSIKLEQFTDQQLRRLVLSSAPQICIEYNDGVCVHGDDCSRIHMCSAHLRKCYKEGRGCGLDHESAMSTDHTRVVLERYHMEHLKSDVVRRILLVYDDPTKRKETGHIHQYDPDAPICSDFLLGKCKKGIKCSGHHCSLPYHWQYKVPEADEWKSFSDSDNERLEKLYCDVTKDDWLTTDFQISFESEGSLLYDGVYDLKFMLDDKLMIIRQGFADVMAEIRRLSSESLATNPGSSMATAWTWYWKDENGMWREYDVDDLGTDLQQAIEDAFLKKTYYYNYFNFTISGQDYVLYFYSATEMHQENVRYGTVKKVRRRPAEFKSRADIRELKRSHKMSSSKQKAGKNATNGNVPSHWSSMPSDTQYRRVPLMARSSEYKEVETLFMKTMENTVKINSIERVQNPFMWEKYQRKKENMSAVKTSGQKRTFVNEKRLFHGTSPETVEAICKQNFDWRLHGKNATKYGQGSYFALNSSYSNAYTKEDASSYRFMFVAKVLVGSYTKGDSSFRRPPPKDPSNPASDLYDSCVDDRSNPTIFVVFDTDQFYPEYIIKYSQEWSTVVYGRATTSASAYSSGINTSRASYPYSSQPSSHYTSSAASRYPSPASTPYSGSSSSSYSSPVRSTSSTRHQSTSSGSQSQNRSSAPNHHRSSSRDNSICSVM